MRSLSIAMAAMGAISCAPAACWAQAAPAVTPSVQPLPPPDAAASALVQQQEYRIGPLDTLEITVFQVEKLSRTLQVDSAGQINYPLIGGVAAAAKTPRQLADEIAARLGERYLQSPQVTVFVKQSNSQKFTVEGAVARPGVYDIQGRMTLLQAIATAQGVADIASLRNVVIFRTIDQKRMAAVVNLNDVRSGKVDDPQIYPSDVIVVASSGSRRALRGILGLTPLFTLFAL
jgi:polysaccharide export outer membrane protein